MLYAVTTIRIGNNRGEFQNTEVNSIMLAKQVENELKDNGCSFDEIDKFLSMEKGQSICCEATITEGIKQGTRFTYIHRIN